MRLYILNITKPYSEDEDGYTGEWFDCPVDFEEVKEKLGVKEVEEIEIADYELPFPYAQHEPVEINGICRQIQEIEGTPVGKELQAIVYKWFQNIEDFLNHKDEILHYDVADPTALAKYRILEEHCFGSCRRSLRHISTMLPMGVSWNKATDTCSLPAVCSAINKAVRLWRKCVSISPT